MEPIQFGNYTLLERISHGGMAEVFRAKSFGEAGFEREVALKVLLPSVASDQDFVNMLIDEAKIAGQLNHANIAQIFDLGVADNRYYIVQEFVKGKDLRAILKFKLRQKTHLDVAKSCYIALKICEGLHYAHNKEDASGSPLNLVHRDISPHNILISDEGEVKIIDFGIAKAEGRATQTMAGLVKGKFAYMSPEQIRGLPVDHRSDVFATGILLHEMLTTRPLFSRSSEFETLKRARSAMAEPPSQVNPKVPGALDTIVLKALARHVDDRYQTAQQFRDALWSFAREHNAFETDGNTAQGAPVDGSEPSIEIDIASEVRDIGEFDKRGAPIQVDDEDGDGYEITVEGDEPTELAPQSLMEVIDDDDDDDEEEDEENLTMVDPGLPFGVPGLAQHIEDEINEDQTSSDFTPTDHDAQWAASAMSPYGSKKSAPYTAPARQSPMGATLDDEASSHRDSAERAAATQAFAEVGGQAKQTANDRRVTAPAIPAQSPSDSLLDPASTFKHASFDEQTVRKPGPSQNEPQKWSATTPATLRTKTPKPGSSTVLGAATAPGAERAATVPAKPGASALNQGIGVMQTEPSPLAALAGQPLAAAGAPLAPYGVPGGPAPYGAPGGPTPYGAPGGPAAHLSPVANNDMAFDEKTGSVPLRMPTPAPVRSPIRPQTAPTQVPGHGVAVTPEVSSKRIYLVMSAVFMLLLAAAATITMVITE